MDLEKMINSINLNANTSAGVRNQFIEVITKQQPNVDLTLDDSGHLNNFSNNETREKFNIFMAGALMNTPALAAHTFGIIAGEVYDELDRWDEDRYGMANDLLFFINGLYIKHFGIGFMKIVERKQAIKLEVANDELF